MEGTAVHISREKDEWENLRESLEEKEAILYDGHELNSQECSKREVINGSRYIMVQVYSRMNKSVKFVTIITSINLEVGFASLLNCAKPPNL